MMVLKQLVVFILIGLLLELNDKGVRKHLLYEIGESNGYLCNTEQDWEDGLMQLMSNELLRTKVGKQGVFLA